MLQSLDDVYIFYALSKPSNIYSTVQFALEASGLSSPNQHLHSRLRFDILQHAIIAQIRTAMGEQGRTGVTLSHSRVVARPS